MPWSVFWNCFCREGIHTKIPAFLVGKQRVCTEWPRLLVCFGVTLDICCSCKPLGSFVLSTECLLMDIDEDDDAFLIEEIVCV